MGMISIVVVVLLLMALLVLLRFKRKEDDSLFPYHKKQLFLSVTELAFYRTLMQVAGDDYVIFAHVRMSDLLKISPELSRRKKLYYFGKVKEEHVDFVLCKPENFRVEAAILLTSRANIHASEGVREHFIVQACEAAKLALLQLREQKKYSKNDVQDLLNKAIEHTHQHKHKRTSKKQNSLVQAANTSHGDEAEDKNFMEIQFAPSSENQLHVDDDKIPLCPKCSAEMVVRKADKGKRAGKYFFMCSRYPECTRAMPVERSMLS